MRTRPARWHLARRKRVQQVDDHGQRHGGQDHAHGDEHGELGVRQVDRQPDEPRRHHERADPVARAAPPGDETRTGVHPAAEREQHHDPCRSDGALDHHHQLDRAERERRHPEQAEGPPQRVRDHRPRQSVPPHIARLPSERHSCTGLGSARTTRPGSPAELSSRRRPSRASTASTAPSESLNSTLLAPVCGAECVENGGPSFSASRISVDIAGSVGWCRTEGKLSDRVTQVTLPVESPLSARKDLGAMFSPCEPRAGRTRRPHQPVR